jgi:hypothetical protein
MASFDMNLDREYDTVHARIADLHTKAAYEHSTANYLQKGCDSDLAHEFAIRGCRHSMEAAELSRQVLEHEPDAHGLMTAAAD